MVELHAAGTVNVIGPVTLNQTVVSLGIILRGMACTPRHSLCPFSGWVLQILATVPADPELSSNTSAGGEVHSRSFNHG